jgi:hypothetical protein
MSIAEPPLPPSIMLANTVSTVSIVSHEVSHKCR